MQTPRLKALLKEVNKLKPDELQKLKLYAGSLGSVTPKAQQGTRVKSVKLSTTAKKAVKNYDKDSDWLLQALVLVAHQQGYHKSKSNTALDNVLIAAPSFMEKSEAVRAELVKMLGAPLPRRLRSWYARRCCTVFVHYHQRLHERRQALVPDRKPFPLSLKVFLQTIDHMPKALNQAFPGYAQAGILHVILPKQKTKRRRLTNGSR